MSVRSPIEVALDVRSYERVVVMADPESDFKYPERWERPLTLKDVRIDPETVLIIDCIELSHETLVRVLSPGPRIVGYLLPPRDLDFEKLVRRTMRTLYPFSEPWTAESTDMGKCLMYQVSGPAYDRDDIIDQRKLGVA